MAGDPNYNSRSLGLHCNGANNSTTFTDNSPNPKTVTAGGNAKISTTLSKFGGASANFDGSGDYLSIPTSSEFGFGTGNFTLSCWINAAVVAGSDRALFDFRLSFSANNAVFFIDNTASNKLAVYDGTTKYGATGTSITTNTWHHIEFVRSGSTLYCFLNGNLDFSATFTTDLGSTRPLGIGGSTVPGNLGSSPFNGYIDDLYIWKAVALHTSAFSVPTAPYDDFPDNFPAVISGATTAPTASIQVLNASPISSQILGATTAPTSGFVTSVENPIPVFILGVTAAPTANIVALSVTPISTQIAGLTTAPTSRFNVIPFFDLAKKTIIGRRYLMTMPGTPDLVVPISSINGRLRSAGQSTLTVVCPDGINYVSGILERVGNGFYVTLIETYNDGTQDQTDSDLFTNISPSHDRGAHNFSVTLTGYATLVLPATARRINVQGIQYQGMQANGARRVRSGLDKDFMPKDIALLPSGEEIIVDAVTYTIGTRQMAMELTEAA